MALEAGDVEQLITDHAAHMADQMAETARMAGSEEDVRIGCTKLIDEFLAKAEIKVRGHHEYGLLGGRIDSKYGGVIIEYKNPKGPSKISEDASSKGAQAAVEQIRKRFEDFQSQENMAPERIFGVGCDGNSCIYVRHRGNQLEVDGPQPVTSHSTERLLRALVSLGARGVSFTPSRLAEDFGADSSLAQRGVRDIYAVIAQTTNEKARTFFSQWKILFGEVCGYDVEGKNAKVKKR